jgi:hypothetical protein
MIISSASERPVNARLLSVRLLCSCERKNDCQTLSDVYRVMLTEVVCRVQRRVGAVYLLQAFITLKVHRVSEADRLTRK